MHICNFDEIATDLQILTGNLYNSAMLVILLSVVAASVALIGGWLALKLKDYLEMALGVTAGIILGLAAFDLLPEIFRISNSQQLSTTWPMIALVTGFLTFHILEKSILLHQSHEPRYKSHSHPYVGLIAAAGLIGHSFLDGVSIGIAFQAGSSIGVAVAVAVIGHRLADGFNATNLMMFHRNKESRTKKALIIAGLMPILGGSLTLLFDLPESSLAVYLGFFAGFLLYLAAGDILPQAHSEGSSRRAVGATVFGVVIIFIVTRFV
jgi:ZIP family zinc transporter